MNEKTFLFMFILLTPEIKQTKTNKSTKPPRQCIVYFRDVPESTWFYSSCWECELGEEVPFLICGHAMPCVMSMRAFHFPEDRKAVFESLNINHIFLCSIELSHFLCSFPVVSFSLYFSMFIHGLSCSESLRSISACWSRAFEIHFSMVWKG